MGNDISLSITPQPLSVNDCFINGELDLIRYYMYKRRLRRQLLRHTQLKEIVNHKRKGYVDTLLSNKQPNYKKRKWRSVKKRIFWIRGEDDNLRVMTPKDTVWFKLYIEPPILGTVMRKLFRNRFRLYHQSFLDLLDEIQQHKLFERWNNPDSVGLPPSSVALLLLRALRYLGRAWTFDDIEEATTISREVIRVFFPYIFNIWEH